MSEKRFDLKLIELLKHNPDYLDDTNELLREKIKNDAWNFDKELINLLLRDETIASHFFDEVDEGRFIFNNSLFIQCLNNNAFLTNSYTQFRNKIGLTIGDKYLRERGEVALAFPYKDCVLEGGQTAEDEKRKEVFFNELLAQDEITRMLDPKVFTNWKRHTATGEQDVTEIKRDENGTIHENLIIKGNNLIALSCLQEQFQNKVKLIYIDPPYNTGGNQETFTYNNTFNHSTYLTFMKNRLDLAKKLLRDDGFIAIAIDHHELFYLGTLADEIFLRENRLGIITVVHKPEGRSQEKFFGTSNEFMLVYAKNKDSAAFRKVILSDAKQSTFDLEDEKGYYKLRSFIRSEEVRVNHPNKFYPIYVSPDLEDITLTEKTGYKKVFPINNNVERIWYVKPQTFQKRVTKGEYVAKLNTQKEPRIFYKVRETEVFTTHWIGKKYNANTYGTQLLKKILGRKSVSYPKSLYTILDIVKLTTEDDDIILDFFAGSCTTGHAVLELNKEDSGNRSFILVEQLKKHVADGKERLQKVIVSEQLHNEYISCELKSDNQTYLDRIQSATDSDTLLEIWSEMCSGASVLQWYLDTDIESAKKEFIAIDNLDQQKKALAELIDKSHLYVHYSEMDDENAGVSDTDKRLTRLFYKGDTDAKKS